MKKAIDRFEVGGDGWDRLVQIAISIEVFGGCFVEDEPVYTIQLPGSQGVQTFNCFAGDKLVHYLDDTWELFEKPTLQSRIMTATAGRWA